jgi:Cof subfamily protein (haloacid dehalogenase superfamily)
LPSVANIVVLDLDGTLLNSKLELSAVNIAAVRQAADAGATIVLASGRPLASVLLHAKSLSCCAYAICCNGAVAVRLDTLEVIVERRPPSFAVSAAINLCIEQGLEVISYTARKAFATRESPAVRLETLRSAIKPDIVGSLHEIGSTIKLLVIGEAPRMPAMLADIAHLTELRATISYPEYIDIVAADVTKASTLSALIGQWGAAWSDVVAFGDGANDVPLIACAGIGVAMANATPEALRAAHFIAPSNDDDGAARAIRALLFDDRHASAALTRGGRS